MLGVAIALILGGVILLFLFPWAGIAAGIVGVVLLVLSFLGVGKRAVENSPEA